MSKSQVIIIALITGVSVLGNEMLLIVMPIYWKFFALDSIWQVGILLSVNRIIRLFINSAVGWCYQKINKRTGIFFAVVLAIISTFSYGFLKGFWLLLFMRLLWGVSWSFLRLGGYLTVISSSDKKSRGHYIGIYNGTWGLGSLVGMLVGGVFAGIVGIQTITTIFTILGIISLPFVLRYIPNSKSVSDNKEESNSNSKLLKDKNLIIVLVNGLFVAFLIYGIFSSTISKIIEYHMHEDITIFSYVFGATAVAGILQAVRTGTDPFFAPFVGKLSDSVFGRIPLLLFALSLGTICFIILPMNLPFILVILVTLVFQIVSTILLTTSDSLAADMSYGPSAVKVMTYYTLVVDIGSALGPLMSYFVIDFIGLNWLYWVISIMMLMSVIYWYKNGFQEKRESTVTF